MPFENLLVICVTVLGVVALVAGQRVTRAEQGIARHGSVPGAGEKVTVHVSDGRVIRGTLSAPPNGSWQLASASLVTGSREHEMAPVGIPEGSVVFWQQP